MKQQVIVKLCQSVTHLLGHGSRLIVLKIRQQKNLEEEESKRILIYILLLNKTNVLT